MKVWQVGVSDCESCYTISICTTKELALREMFKKRDQLISEWKEFKIDDEKYHTEFIAEQAAKGIVYSGEDGCWRDMYGGMIQALSSNNYEEWDNYPHEVPWIQETEVIDE